MSLPLPNELCGVCQNLMADLISRDIPWEDEAAIPHQPNIVILEESSQTCALCYQVWVAAGRSLANRGGMVSHMPRKKIGDRDVTIQAAASNFGMGGMFRAMANGAMVTNTSDAIVADLSELEWMHPRSVAHDPYKVGSYIFGNWYQSPFQGQEGRLMLIGLGVRLGTSPHIGDALGNKPDEWFLAGSYLRFRTQHGNDVSYCIPGRIRNWDLSSARAMSQVKSWLDICDTHHECLKKSEEGPLLPTRVLSIDDSSNQVCLLESNGQRARYIALSHSWGKSHRLTLTKSNLATLRAGIDTNSIPQTFQDAINICRALQVSYLWIDSLCIVQDDPADWELEAAKMSSVYMDSYLTVSALHSADDADGCFPSIARQTKSMPSPFVSPDVVCTGRPTVANAIPLVIPKESIGTELDSYNHAVVFSMHGSETGKYYITNEWMPPSIESSTKKYGTFNFGASYDPLKPEPLSSRGWVLQERLLSQRTLHYSEGQIYWECQSIVLGEDGSMLKRMFPQVQTLTESRQKAINWSITPTDTSSKYVADEWLRLIEVFSTRKLTMDYDKLVAISGLAQIVAEKSGDEYYAGIWKSNLVNSLCWKRKIFVPSHHCNDEGHKSCLPEATSSTLTTPADFRAPSWSWASVDGEIEFTNMWLAPPSGEGVKIITQSATACVTPLGSYSFGRIKHGVLTLNTVTGKLCKAEQMKTKRSSQLPNPYHVEATMWSDTTGRATLKQEQDSLNPPKSFGLKKLMWRLSTSKRSTSSLIIPATILFDIEPQFPCEAAFITNKLALVLSRDPEKGTLKRIGIAEFSEKDTEKYLTAAPRQEVLIM